MRTVLFSFEDDVARDEFLSFLGTVEVNDAQGESDQDFVKKALNTIRLDPPIKEDHERTVSVWVSGSKMHEGPLSEMQKVFDQELASHSASVTMKELRGGEWEEIRARRKQP